MVLVITIHDHQLWHDALEQNALPTFNAKSDMTYNTLSHCVTSPVSFDDIEKFARSTDRLVITYLSPDIRIAELLEQGKKLSEALESWKDEALKTLSVHKTNRRKVSLLNLEQLTQVSAQGTKNLQEIGWPLKNSVSPISTTLLRVIARQAIYQSDELSELAELLLVSSYRLSSQPLTLNLDEAILLFDDEANGNSNQNLELKNSFSREKLLLDQLFSVQQQLETTYLSFKELEKSNKNLNQENEIYRRKVAALNKASAVNNIQIDKLKQQLVKIHNSTFWKIIKPFRVVKQKMTSRSEKKLLKENIMIISNSEFFDDNWYLENNSDVSESKINPAEHYLLYGAQEGRNPSNNFDTNWYLNEYPDVEKSGMNPLIHFLKYGYNEKRIPYPKRSNRSQSLK